MYMKVVEFRRTKESKYEKGIDIETNNNKKPNLLLDKDGNELGEIYDIRDMVTIIDLNPFLK